MPEFPPLGEPDIREWVGERSFDKARAYHERGAIAKPRVQGMTLKAECWGTAEQPYHVDVTLGKKGIERAECSCPVGTGGHCKHVAALLLTWLHQTEDFRELEETASVLGRLEKHQLIALIERMLKRYPDLEDMLELPDLGAAPEAPVNAEAIRRQVKQVYPRHGYSWGVGAQIARDLMVWLDTAETYLRYESVQSVRNAATIYTAVLETVFEESAILYEDEEGHLHEVLDRCVESLGECLHLERDGEQRQRILRALFAALKGDIAMGGYDLGGEAPSIILANATLQEREYVAGLVRSALTECRAESSGWGRQRLGDFLLELEKDTLDDEAYIRICREMGRAADLIERLLSLRRVGEATTDARQAGDYELLQLAGLFVRHGHGELAEGLIRERSRTSTDSRLVEWLKQQAMASSDLEEALALSETLFWRHPSVQGYSEIKAVAVRLGRWEQLRHGIHKHLAQDKQFALLAELHVIEGDADDALATLKQLQAGQRDWGSWGYAMDYMPLSIRVARVIEEGHPQEAIDLYLKPANRIIEARDRANYATAAGYLARVRELYRRLGDEAKWQETIGALRAQKTLRALQVELTAAGL